MTAPSISRRYIDATPVREHLQKLQAIGWTINAIAAANGHPGKLVTTLRQILRGQQTCAPSTRDYVMWMDPERPSEFPDMIKKTGMWRVGKKRAGRELDGLTWDQYPEAVL